VEDAPLRSISGQNTIARGDLSNQRPLLSDEARLLVPAVAIIAGTLLALSLISVQQPDEAARPLLHQMAETSRLIHDARPAVGSLSSHEFIVLSGLSVACLWLVYFRVLWATRHASLSHHLVARCAVVVNLAAFAVPPLFSSDIYAYALFGRIASVYRLNPHVTSAREGAAGDPVLPYLYWQDIPSPYGPVWTHVSWAITFRHATPLELVIRFKLAALVAALLAGWLVYLLAREASPEYAGWAWLAFTLNPLVLVEGVATGHNDIFILLMLLAAAWALARAYTTLALVGLVVSALIKYSTVPIVAITGVRLLFRAPPRERLATGLVLALAGAGTLAAAFLPYWAGFDSLASTFAEPGRGINNPVVLAAGHLLLKDASMLSGNPASATFIAGLCFSIFAGDRLVRSWTECAANRTSMIDSELALWALTMTVFLLLWPRQHAWYFIVPIGLALAAGGAHRKLFVAVCAFALFSNLTYFL
jgi:hypothetical protein